VNPENMKVLIIFLAIYLSVRYFIPSILRMLFADIFKTAEKKSNFENTSKKNKGKTNEKYGEYIDYEDID
jgi:uncharacterized protein HemY